MSKAKLLDNGNLLIPVRVEADNGIFGDAMIEVKPDSEQFKQWLPFLDQEEQERINR